MGRSLIIGIIGLIVSALSLFSGPRDQQKATVPVIKMGYRTTAKLPYIQAEPNQSGLFYDLYSEAARRIGTKLVVIRLPKKRVLQGLEEGTIDFYPGFAFNMERAKYSIWFVNGIKQRDIAISTDRLLRLENGDDLNGLRYLQALGNPDYLKGIDVSGIAETTTVAELGVDRAITLLKKGRADFYIYEEETLKYYVLSQKIKGMKFHPDLIKRFYWMHAGFSRNSPLYEGVNNPGYDKDKPISRSNFPYLLKKGSVPDLFKDALWEMYEEGYTDSLYRVYFEGRQ